MKTYLVTGGAGFIGSHLVDSLLQKGERVITIDNFCNYYDPKIKEDNIKEHLKNPNFVLYRTDIRNYDELRTIFVSNKIDTVIHLAAMAGVRPSIENPMLYQEVNIMGSLNIMELMKEFNIKKLVFASSSSVYGNSDDVPFNETQFVDYAISPYAATKKSNEVMGHVYHSLYEFDSIYLRFFTVYGPRQRPDLAIHKFTKLIDNNQEIPFYGDGSTSRDYTYIDDIIDGVMKSITYVETNSNVYEIINLGESQTITLNEMVSCIEKALNKNAIRRMLPMQMGDVERTYADITKAKKMLGYNPTTKYAAGILKFVSWYQDKKNK